MITLGKRIIHVKNNVENTLPTTIVKDGYIVRREGKRLNPYFIAVYIERDNIDKESVRNLTFDKLTAEQLKYVWRIDTEIDGQMFKYGEALCDEKTEKYIESTKENIKYVESVAGYEEALGEAGYIEKSSRKIDSGYLNTSDVDIMELEKDGKTYTGLQYSMQTDIDDYAIFTYIFDKPYIKAENVRNMFEISKIIDDIQFEINIGRWKDIYNCWECGCETHWLDVPEKGIVEKFHAKKEKYCGC